MSKYYRLKTYIKPKKRNCKIPISNKIMIKKWDKNDCLHILYKHYIIYSIYYIHYITLYYNVLHI